MLRINKDANINAGNIPCECVCGLEFSLWKANI